MRLRVRSLALLRGLRNGRCREPWLGCRCGLDPVLLWLWPRPSATAPIRPLAWELPYAEGVALEKAKRPGKKKKKKKNYLVTRGPVTLCLRGSPSISHSSPTWSGGQRLTTAEFETEAKQMTIWTVFLFFFFIFLHEQLIWSLLLLQPSDFNFLKLFIKKLS